MDQETRHSLGIIGAILVAGTMIAFQLGGTVDGLAIVLCLGFAFLMPITWHFLSSVARALRSALAGFARFFNQHISEYPGDQQSAPARTDDSRSDH